MGVMQNIVALVTGGAKGIGKAVVEKIVCGGGKVVIADISNKGKQLAESLGDNAVFACTDVTLEKDVLESMKLVKEKFGGVNVLVNTAGILDFIPVHDFKTKKPHSAEIFKKIYNVNVWGLFNVTRLVVGLMAENKPDKNGQRGVVINLASMVAFDQPPGMCCYGSTKAAVAGMTLPMAREFAQKGIRVVGICPGFIDTPMTGVINPEDKKRWISMMLSPKRFGCPEEVAHLISTCIENPIINGENIRIHQGFWYSQVNDVPKEETKKC